MMDQIAKALQDIFDRDSVLKPSSVLKMAMKKSSPLHDRFEWDDAKAGHEHRLDQARRLIRVTPIIYEGEPDRMIHVRAKITPSEGEYLPTRAVVKTQSKYERAYDELSKQIGGVLETMNTLRAAAEGEGITGTAPGLILIQRGLTSLQKCA